MNLTNRQNRFPPQWLINGIQSIRYFLSAVEKRLVPAKFAVLDMTMQFMVSKAIWAAAELNIAEHLRKGPRSIENLASLSETHAESLYRMLRLLSEYGIFRQVKPRTFALTRLSRALYNDKGSIRPMIRLIGGENNWESFAQILYCLRTGHSARARNGRETFEELRKNPHLNDLFNSAMTAICELAGDAILAAYTFPSYHTIVDIGGGQGTLILSLLTRYPGCKGILFALPQVIERARPMITTSSVAKRVNCESGDFFNAITTGGDLFILKNVLHDWDDEHCRMILKCVGQAMDSHTTLLIIETIVTNNNKRSIGSLYDLQMLVSIDGGKERTLKEFTALLSPAHFHINRIVPTSSNLSIIECKKE